MNRGYAFGFLIVLLVLVLGMYVAYTGFVSSREALRSQAPASISTAVGQAPRPTVTPLPPVTVVTPAGVTPTIPVTVSVVTVAPPATVEAPPATEPPPSTPTPPPAALATSTPAPPGPPPTPVPPVTYQFRLAGPPAGDPNYIAGPACYLHGTVRDAAGNGLEGVQVQVLNEWATLPPTASKGGAEIGQYNIPIGCDVVTWYVVVLDAAGNQISTKAQVQFDPNVANAFRIDWQRAY